MAKQPRVAVIALSDIREGQTLALDIPIPATDIDAFAALSGDVNPLHVDEAFAQSRGFRARVVHGAFLASLVSQLVGVHLPGRDCLMHAVQLKFPNPAFVGDTVRVAAEVTHVSEAMRALVLKITISNAQTGLVLAKGTVTVGVTAETGA
jgi:acyl dehydratase